MTTIFFNSSLESSLVINATECTGRFPACTGVSPFVIVVFVLSLSLLIITIITCRVREIFEGDDTEFRDSELGEANDVQPPQPVSVRLMRRWSDTSRSKVRKKMSNPAF